MPDKRKPPESLAGDRAAQERTRTEILHGTDDDRKQDFGRCPCGAQIGAVHTIGCKTCVAWARWRSAFRVAVHALRGPQ